MAGYLGTKAVLLSTTAADVVGNAEIGGDLTVDTDTLYVDSSNNRVGIGTSSPDFAVEVEKTSGNAQLSLKSQNTGYSEIYLGDTDAVNAGAISYDHPNNAMKLYTNSTERMRIDASGNVRVGFNSSLSYPSDARLMVSNDGTNGMEFSNTAISGQNRILNYNRTTSAYVPMTTVGSELKFDIGTSEAMRIDSSGRVTMPYQPAFVANTAPALLVNNETIIFSSTALNRGSVYNTSNGRFTAPVAGLYQFFSSVRIELSSPTAVYHRVSFIHNGTGISWSKSRLNSRTTTGYYTHAASDQLIGCQAGDYVEVQFESSVGSFSTSAPAEHVFYGYLIG